MIVLKFGGTSVEDAPAIRRVTEIVRRELPRHPVVVVSACSGVTNMLLKLGSTAAAGKREEAQALVRSLEERHLGIAADLFGPEGAPVLTQAIRGFAAELATLAHGIGILGELTGRSLDLLASFGERMSSLIIASYWNSGQLTATLVDARMWMITDGTFQKATPDLAAVECALRQHVLPASQRSEVVLTQGFVGSTPEGITTTIGRGGSDYSAALIGALLQAEEIQIWTDVDGILTADPTLVPEARNIKVMSFNEAAELAYFGARVLHPDTILPAISRGIPVRVMNSRRPGSPGTLIVATPRTDARCIVKSVAYKERISLVNIVSTRMFLAHGFLENVFDVFHKYGTVVHTVATSDVSVTATVNDVSHLEQILAELRAFATVSVSDGKAIVCVVGDNLRNSHGIAARILTTIQDVNINMISQGGSEINISFVVDEDNVPVVVRRLHAELFRDAETMKEIFA